MTLCKEIVLCVLLSALSDGADNARSCRVAPTAPEAPVSGQVGLDTAEFSFLIGRDFIGDAGAMTLARRLRTMSDFNALRGAAAHWGELHARANRAADTLIGLSDVVAGLQQYCDQLDAVGLDPSAPLDEANWNSGIARLEQRLDTAIAATEPVVPQLDHYASLVKIAARYYGKGNYAANRVIRIGPPLDATASGLGEVAGRWRALLADLKNARKILPVKRERESERSLINITAAMQEIRRVTAEARALSANRLGDAQFKHIETGDYLYDQCPMIKEGQWYGLESQYWARKNGREAWLSAASDIMPKSKASGIGYVVGADRWQFIKNGSGYWLIRNGATGERKAPDIAGDPDGHVHLTMSETNGQHVKYSGQMWRCAATDRPGEIRLYNVVLSESKAIDTYRNTDRAVMADAGYYAAQYWRVVPR